MSGGGEGGIVCTLPKTQRYQWFRASRFQRVYQSRGPMSPPFVSAIQFSAPHLRFESARTLNLVSKGSLFLTDIFETDQGA
jgi:hypothetical protein